MYAMFNSCAKLETLKIGTWDVSGVTVFENMFGKCNALKNIDVKNWNVSNAQNMAFMFRQCDALISLDLSGWETASLTQTTQMFEGDGLLTTIYVGDGWDMSKVTTSDSKEMFSSCSSLEGGKGTTLAKIDAIEGIKDEDVINKTYARVDTEGTLGYLTHIKDKPAESEQN
jgi:surface protein